MGKAMVKNAYCPKCGSVWMPGNESCGTCRYSASASSGDSNTSMPTLGGLKSDLAAIISAQKVRAAVMPPQPEDAARWWLKTQKPHQDYEAPFKKNNWMWPYADRVTYTLKKFLRLSDEFQRLIVDAAHEGIFWRGDDQGAFTSIVHEALKMQEMGVFAYRKQAMDRLKTLKKRFVADVRP